MERMRESVDVFVTVGVSMVASRDASGVQAGKAVVKRAVDGWHFWSYERAPKDWVKIDELRR